MGRARWTQREGETILEGSTIEEANVTRERRNNAHIRYNGDTYAPATVANGFMTILGPF